MSQIANDKLNNLNNILNDSLGFAGGIYIADTNPHDGNYFALTALTDCTFSDVDDPAYGSPITGIESATIPAGTTIYVRCSSITLAGGTCIAYYV